MSSKSKSEELFVTRIKQVNYRLSYKKIGITDLKNLFFYKNVGRGRYVPKIFKLWKQKNLRKAYEKTKFLILYRINWIIPKRQFFDKKWKL